MVLTFESVDEILKCDHSNESNLAILSCGVLIIITIIIMINTVFPLGGSTPVNT